MEKKKDPSEGSHFCIDFTAVNRVMKKDAYPIPLISDIFNQPKNESIFSTIDLKVKCYQPSLHLDKQEKIVFNCH